MINRKNKNKPKIHKSGAIIKSATESKLIESEFYKGKTRKYNSKTLNVINKMASKISKTASSCGGTDVRMGSPQFYHPEYEPSSLLLPHDPIEINAWCRYFYKYDALVATAIDAHAELPISTIRLTTPQGTNKKKCEDIREEYEDMCSTSCLDLFNKLLQTGVEYYKLGNVFPFTQWSEKQKRWTRITILDPDYIEVDKLEFTNKMRVDLRPNDRLRQIISNGENHPKTGLLYSSLPQDVVELIRGGKKIPLNTDPNMGSHVAHIAYKMADYDAIGTGLIERNFKPLVYKDRLRQAQDAIAARHLTPKSLIHAENASNADIDAIREQVDNAFANPDYAIITNYELHWELIGTGQSMMQLDSEWNWINEELMIGLMINKSFLLGEGAYSNGQTVLEVMNQRYSIYRERLEAWIINNLFLPMAKRNDWVEYVQGTLKKEKIKRYLYPRIKWNRLNFVDDTAHKQMLSQMVQNGQVDIQTWLESFGLDSNTIQDRLKRFEGTPLDVNYFEQMRGVSTEVGRLLAPAIAKQRALELGVDLPQEENQNQMFASKKDKITKVSEKIDEIEKKADLEKDAETREQREYERKMKRIKRRTNDAIDSLKVNDKKLVKPSRDDLKKVDLFASESDNNVLNVLIDDNKKNELLNKIQKNENSLDSWKNELNDLNISQNSKRISLLLEEDLLTKSSSRDRIKSIRAYIPQILVEKFDDDNLSLSQKTEKAKEKFQDKILDISFTLESKLSKAKNDDERKNIIRSTIKDVIKDDK